MATKEFLKADVLSISPFPEQIEELCLGLGMVYNQKDEAMPIVETCIVDTVVTKNASLKDKFLF